jgi:group I intron endonuclease
MQIYKTTNILNGKIYIGKSAYDNPNYYGSGKYIKRSIKKHGKENFKKEIICFCNTEKELNELEIYYIEKFNSTNLNIGYNLTKGGEGILGFSKPSWCKGLTKETDERIRKLGENTSKTIKENGGNKGKKNPMFGKHHTEETKEKISISHIGKKNQKISQTRIEKGLSKGKNNPNYGKKLWSGENNPKFKKGYLIKGDKNPNYGKRYKQMNNCIKNKMVLLDEVDNYLDQGWIFGFINNKVFKS